jgi:F-type H+-transporting ATPase subunit b
MKRFLNRRLALLFFLVCLSIGVVTAQQQPQSAPPAQSQPSAQQAQPVNPNTAAGGELASESEKAVHAAEGHEEYSEFKYSDMVARLGRAIGIDAHGMYWVSLVINFAILALFFWMLLKSRLPQMFRERTSAIQKALKEAHDASADASRRLTDIEARLSKLDAEVADIRAAAEREAVSEEERIRVSAEEDKHKVVEAAEAEIAAIARSARHDLKSFAASLAVDIAAHKIKVDHNTDQALVRQFVGHLGKDGQ